MFFLFGSISIAGQIRHSALMRFLFAEMVFFAAVELSGQMFHAFDLWENAYLSNATMLFFTWIVPLTVIFVFELIQPRWASPRRTAAVMMPSVVLFVLYLLFPSREMFYASIVLCNILGAGMVIAVFLSTSRYDNYIKRNFSFIEHNNLRWLRWIILPLFMMLFVYNIALWEDVWLVDTLYFLTTIAVWMFIYHYTKRHIVVEVPDLLNPFRKEDDDGLGSETGKEYYEMFPFHEKLSYCMDHEHIYRNPTLSITDMAAAIGTNRTYLSAYLNRELKTTFYDYVNNRRVSMACSLLEDVSNNSVNMEDIAEQCGFGSISTFRRSFHKITGHTPASYRNHTLRSRNSRE